MKLFLNLILISSLGLSALPNATLAAPVKSMSLEVFKDGPQRLWEVVVDCEAAVQARVMVRPIRNGQWCSFDIKTLCDKNKFSLSSQLCSNDFSRQLINFKSGRLVSSVKADPVSVEVAEQAAEATTQAANPIISSGSETILPLTFRALRSKGSATQEEAKKIAGIKTDLSAKGSTGVSKNNQNSVASRENLISEQMQIEEQRILIDQKRLELRRKKLELQKRQLNAN
ncbi:MAG: hypothetical protein ACI854_001281 [Arenicella sp.]|jgi:hypothetical protein